MATDRVSVVAAGAVTRSVFSQLARKQVNGAARALRVETPSTEGSNAAGARRQLVTERQNIPRNCVSSLTNSVAECLTSKTQCSARKGRHSQKCKNPHQRYGHEIFVPLPRDRDI